METTNAGERNMYTVKTAQEEQGADFDGSTGFYVLKNGVAINYFDTETEALKYIAKQRA